MKRFAFTLIELLITITIIGLLTGVSAIAFATAQRNGRDTARRTTLSSIANAVEVYRTAERRYPGLVIPSDAANCTHNNTYYYSPVGGGCSAHDSQLVSGLPGNAFTPPPTWIPGLGKYLSPAPIESRFEQTGTPPRIDSTNGAPEDIRTFTYRRMSSGFFVHTRTEGTPCGGQVCSISR